MEPDEAQRVLADKGIMFNVRGEIPRDASRKDLEVEMVLTIDDIVWTAPWIHAA
jgi:hypothetical protein